jgi:hypothetical protein
LPIDGLVIAACEMCLKQLSSYGFACFALFLTMWFCSVYAERSCYQGGEVAEADEGEEEQGEEDPWCEEGMLIYTHQTDVP